MLGLTGTATLTAIGGCIESPESGEGNDGEASNFMDAYVLVYHWGYTPFDENGNELDLIEIPTETELTLHVVNDHAYEALETLPDSVTEACKNHDALARTKEKVHAGHLPEPEGKTIEEVYADAHGEDVDSPHGHGDDDHHDDHRHDDHDHEHAHLDHGFMIADLDVTFEVPADASEPQTETVRVEEPGTYEAMCIVPCGYYHTEQREDLIEAYRG